MHGPMLQTSGTADTVGLPMQQYTYQMSQVQTFLGTVSGADHGYIQTTVDGVPGGVETPAIIAWLRYWIYNDTGGAALLLRQRLRDVHGAVDESAAQELAHAVIAARAGR